MLRRVPQRDAQHIAPPQPERAEMRGEAPHERIEVAVENAPPAMDDRRPVRPGAGMMRQRLGEVHARP